MKNLFTTILFLCIITANSQCFTKVDAGGNFTIGLKSDNTLWAWGTNYLGEFGNGTTVGSATPIQIGIESNWVSIATGQEYTLALKSNGTLWAWGNNAAGQLGDGTTTNRNTPIQIGTENDWQFISTKGFTSFAIKNNGTLWGWGQNTVSNLGLGFYSYYQNIPTQVGTDNDWKSIVAGSDHTIAIKNNNTLWGWGSNLKGEMGNGTFLGNVLTPTQIGTENNWKTASTGHENTISLKFDGTLWAWGGNSHGELGDGTTTDKNIPIQIGNETNWKFIFSDYITNFAIKNDNSLWVWGDNTYYEFGNGTTINSSIPIQVGTETNWNYISPGAYHKVALKNDNSVYLWGVNPFSSLPTMPSYTNTTQFSAGCSLSVNSYANSLITIYPNPTNDIINVTNNSNEKITNITIYDITGKLILHQKENTSINIANLNSGVYILYVETQNTMEKIKLIKT